MLAGDGFHWPNIDPDPPVVLRFTPATRRQGHQEQLEEMQYVPSTNYDAGRLDQLMVVERIKLNTAGHINRLTNIFIVVQSREQGRSAAKPGSKGSGV